MATEAETPRGDSQPPPVARVVPVLPASPVPPALLVPPAAPLVPPAAPPATASAASSVAIPTPSSAVSSIPQKRVLIEDDHAPAVPSPLNPDSKTAKPPQPPPLEDTPAMAREKRTKKETLKKREAKGALAGVESSRATPEPKRKDAPKPGAGDLPVQYKLQGPLRPSDFDQPQGPVFRSHHEVQGPDGKTIEFFETAEQ